MFKIILSAIVAGLKSRNQLALENIAFRHQLSIARAAPVRIAIHDLRGCCVTVLADGYLQPGSHDYVWTGKNDRGVTMPTGTYVVRVETPFALKTEKIAIVR